MERPTLHRVQTVLVGTYFLVFLAAVAIISTLRGGTTVMGGSFMVLYLSWLVVGVALCMGVLLLWFTDIPFQRLTEQSC